MLKLEREDIGRLVMTGEGVETRLYANDGDELFPYYYIHHLEYPRPITVTSTGRYSADRRTKYDVVGWADGVRKTEDESRPEGEGVVQKSVVRPQDLRDEQLKKMRQAFEDVIWMAIRYADGRHTYAPSMVRDAIKEVKEVFTDFKLKEDGVIEKPKEIDWMGIPSDYLWDLFEEDRKAEDDDRG